MPHEELSFEIILPNQTHGVNIVEIITGEEDLSDCDGVWTRDPRFRLGIRTADCAPIVFWDGDKFGIVHAGWRGLVGGICEQMLKIFNPSLDNLQDDQTRVINEYVPMGLKVFVGPILPRFEIQRDFCYEAIRERFGERYFDVEAKNPSALSGSSLSKREQVWFDFEGVLRSVLPMAEFDGRSTFEDLYLASWRRDQNELRNVTVISKK